MTIPGKLMFVFIQLNLQSWPQTEMWNFISNYFYLTIFLMPSTKINVLYLSLSFFT